MHRREGRSVFAVAAGKGDDDGDGPRASQRRRDGVDGSEDATRHRMRRVLSRRPSLRPASLAHAARSTSSRTNPINCGQAGGRPRGRRERRQRRERRRGRTGGSARHTGHVTFSSCCIAHNVKWIFVISFHLLIPQFVASPKKKETIIERPTGCRAPGWAQLAVMPAG